MDDATGTTAKDLSGNGNNGTLTNGPTWAQGKYGGAVKLNNETNNYISLANTYSAIGRQSLTVSGWAKIPSNATDRVGNFFGNFPDNSNVNLEVHSAGNMRIYWNNGEINAYGTTNLKDSSWHFLAYVRDKEKNHFRLYIDGKIEAEFNGSGTRSEERSVGKECRTWWSPYH